MKILLFPFSFLYGCITWVRNKLYDWEIFSSKKFTVPVISVGNLSMGGTGKTPHIEYLIRKYKDQFNIAVLSRGYGRKTNGFYEVTSAADYKDVGDEPVQFKSKFPDLKIFVDEKRVNGIEQILKKYPDVNLILLDDAFQHRAVKPAVNILLTDYNDLFVNDHVVPAGRLREFSFGSKRADVIIITKSPEVISEDEKKRIANKLKISKTQKIYFSSITYAEPLLLFGAGEWFTPDSVLLVTGIANSKPLFAFIQQQYKNVNHISFPDHYDFKASDIAKVKTAFTNLSGAKKVIITTEKDAVRLKKFRTDLQSISVFYWPVTVRFSEPFNIL